MMMNKKGQSSTIGVIIAIVLGIALIVFLIWGFSTNWNMFSSTSKAYAGSTSVDTVNQACQMQCQNHQKAEFCDVSKTVVLADKSTVKGNCNDLKVDGKLSFSCASICICSGTPTEGKEQRTAEGDVIPCSAKNKKADCVGYEGCAWN